jgi:hypothetical protein
MAQVIEHLFSKHKVLDSIPSTEKKKKKKVVAPVIVKGMMIEGI